VVESLQQGEGEEEEPGGDTEQEDIAHASSEALWDRRPVPPNEGLTRAASSLTRS